MFINITIFAIILPVKSLGNCGNNLLIENNQNSNNNYFYENINNNFNIINNKSFFEPEYLKLRTYFFFNSFNSFKTTLNENFREIKKKYLRSIHPIEKTELNQKLTKIKLFIDKISEYIFIFVNLNNEIYTFDRKINELKIDNKTSINQISGFQKELDLFSKEVNKFFKRLSENENIDKETIKNLKSCFNKWIEAKEIHLNTIEIKKKIDDIK